MNFFSQDCSLSPVSSYPQAASRFWHLKSPSPEEANEQAKLVSDDGYGIGLKYINWIVDPQYFKNGNIIVGYGGSQSLITKTLIASMGEQFAGENSVGA